MGQTFNILKAWLKQSWQKTWPHLIVWGLTILSRHIGHLWCMFVHPKENSEKRKINSKEQRNNYVLWNRLLFIVAGGWWYKFVLLSHNKVTRCRSRCFNCLLQVFFRRRSQPHLLKKTCSMQLKHHNLHLVTLSWDIRTNLYYQIIMYLHNFNL